MADKNSTNHHHVTFDFPIKSILPGKNEDLLLIETSDAKLKEQAFLLLSLSKMEIVQAIAFGTDYQGLVVKSYDADQLLFVQYSNQNNPDQTNVYSFTWNGGDPILSLNHTRIIKSGPDWILIPHPHFANKEIYVNTSTGLELDKSPNLEDECHNTPLVFATAYPDSSEYFDWFRQYFDKHRIVPCLQIEYLKSGGHIFISFYHQEDKGLANSLAIIDENGQLLECILLEEQLPGIGKDTFFVLRNKAIFVTEKRTLNIYDL